MKACKYMKSTAICRYVRRSFALAALFAATLARAAYVPDAIWTQDFEEAASYADELRYGGVRCALLGTAEIPVRSLAAWGKYEVKSESWSAEDYQNYNCTISPETRTRQANGADAGSSTYLRAAMHRLTSIRPRAETNADLVFLLPDATVAQMRSLGEYMLEFDYYLGPSYSNGSSKSTSNTATNGLVIATSDGEALAVACTKAGTSSASHQGQLFTADSTSALAADAILVGSRGSYNTKGLWMHFTLHASHDGIVMDVSQESGATIAAGAKLRDDFAVIDRLYLHAHVEQYSAAACLDDVVVSRVYDIVAVEPPIVPNATLLSATTNGVPLQISNDGLYRVIRNESVEFSWAADDGYELNASRFALVASDELNTIPDEKLPVAIDTNASYMRLRDLDGVMAAIVKAPAELRTLSVEAVRTLYALELAQTLSVSNVAFTTGARLIVKPGAAFDDGDTLIAWLSPRTLDGFSLESKTAAKGWTLRAENDGLKLYLNRCTVNGKSYPTLEDAFAAASDGDSIRLNRDSSISTRIDVPAGISLVLDLNGHSLAANSLWAFNVGDASLAVRNGNIACRAYGFYVTSGTLVLENCTVAAGGRVAQVRGSGCVEIANDATLSTSGDDPVVFAVGGTDGKAQIVSRGRIEHAAAAAADSAAFCFAGNPNDTFGTDFSVNSAKAAFSASGVEDCIYHPASQGGAVMLSSGWFSLMPHEEWLLPERALRRESLAGQDGWRVLHAGASPLPQIADPAELAAVFEEAIDAENLAANIADISEYDAFRSWVAANVAGANAYSSPFAWAAYAIDSPLLFARLVPLTDDDVEISEFSASASDGSFTLVTGLRDYEIGKDADTRRLAALFGLEGADSLSPNAFSSDNIAIDTLEKTDGKLKFTARPANYHSAPFFLRTIFK